MTVQTFGKFKSYWKGGKGYSRHVFIDSFILLSTGYRIPKRIRQIWSCIVGYLRSSEKDQSYQWN